MAESGDAAVAVQRGEATEATAGDILEEDAFDRILGAKRKDLLELGFSQRRHVRNRA